MGARWRGSLLTFAESSLASLQAAVVHLTGFLHTPALRAENARLRQQLLALPHESVHREELAQEVARLRRLLQLKQSSPSLASVAARVIGQDATPWFRTVLLDVGRDDGIREGYGVVMAGGLIGQVLEVGPSVSRVLLTTDPRFRVGALVQRSRAQGLVVGTVNGRCILTYVATADALKVGDVVVTSGMGGMIPKGWMIGRVARLERDPSGLYDQATLTPAVDLGTLEEVLCLTP